MIFILMNIAVICFIITTTIFALIGGICFYEFMNRFDSTIKTIIYSSTTIIVFTTFSMDLSYRGLPIWLLYIIAFVFLGFCIIPIRLFRRFTDRKW